MADAVLSAMLETRDTSIKRMVDAIAEALAIADELGLTSVGIDLDAARLHAAAEMRRACPDDQDEQGSAVS